MPEKINEIEKFRAQIDIIDQTILELIGKRHNIANNIGEIKKNLKIAVYNRGREKELLCNIKEKAKQLNLNEEYIEEVWSKIMEESKRMQRKVKNGG